MVVADPVTDSTRPMVDKGALARAVLYSVVILYLVVALFVVIYAIIAMTIPVSCLSAIPFGFGTFVPSVKWNVLSQRRNRLWGLPIPVVQLETALLLG